MSGDNDRPSMSTIILEPLNELQALSHSLFLSLSPPHMKPPPPPSIDAFLACDRKLASAITLAHVHQVKQRKIEALKEEILHLDANWREICIELERGQRELQSVIEEGDERSKAIEDAKNGS